MSSEEFGGTLIEEAPEGTIPNCPFCRKELDKIWIKKKGIGIMEQKQVLMCPHCRALLGYGVFGGR